jgi:hypothetical protein
MKIYVEPSTVEALKADGCSLEQFEFLLKSDPIVTLVSLRDLLGADGFLAAVKHHFTSLFEANEKRADSIAFMSKMLVHAAIGHSDVGAVIVCRETGGDTLTYGLHGSKLQRVMMLLASIDVAHRIVQDAALGEMQG